VHTEAVVEEALRRVLHHVTGIVVAHRASTVLLADKVALLSEGTITHIGTHAHEGKRHDERVPNRASAISRSTGRVIFMAASSPGTQNTGTPSFSTIPASSVC